MKKTFGIYSIIWALCLGIFNIFTFVTPSEILGYSKFTGTFWVGYVFITVTFVGQLICALFAFKGNNINKLFYKLSLISVSYSALVTIVIIGSIFMALPFLPAWLGIIVCALAFGLNAIAIVKSSAAVEVVSGIDNKIKAQTFFIKSLTVEATSLVNSAKSSGTKAAAEKVYEEIRYSDPMSSTALADVEMQIQKQFSVFSGAVLNDDALLSEAEADMLIILLKKRNEMCKFFK